MTFDDLFKSVELNKTYEEHSADKVELGESAGLLPDISNVGCTGIDEAIRTAEGIAQVWRPTPELVEDYNKWMELAKKKQADCKGAVITPIPKNKISKNLTPIVFLVGAVVAGIIVSKITNK